MKTGKTKTEKQNSPLPEYSYRFRPGYLTQEYLIEFQRGTEKETFMSDLTAALAEINLEMGAPVDQWMQGESWIVLNSDIGSFVLTVDHWDLVFILAEKNQEGLERIDEILARSPTFEREEVDPEDYQWKKEPTPEKDESGKSGSDGVVEFEFILYVADQTKSTAFYTQMLGMEPSLNVPGMTEFTLREGLKIGLMPESGIAKIITPAMSHPKTGAGIPRCELYLKVGDAAAYLGRGIAAGGKEISALAQRDWGDKVGYLADADGHIIAFAE